MAGTRTVTNGRRPVAAVLRRVAPAVLVAVAAVLAFAAVVPGSRFVFDDHVLIEKNRDLLAGDVFWAAFARDYFETTENRGGSGYYRPIPVVVNAIDARLWGLRRPTGYHVTNLLLHAGASVALAGALAAMGVGWPAAWVTALVFAVHPAHAESVAFISGRGDVLAGLCTFLALVLAGSQRRFAAVGFGIAALCAYLSKEAAVVLPALLLLVWRARPRGATEQAETDLRTRWTIRWTIFGVVSLVALLLRYAALGRLLPASAANTASGDVFVLPAQSFGFALASLYAPMRRLAMEPSPASLSLVHVASGVVVAALLFFAAWRLAPASRAGLRRVTVAAVVAVLPVLNWLPQETQLSERFFYLASGFALAPAGIVAAAVWRARPALQPVVAGATALVVLGLFTISGWRAMAWRDDIVLWRIATTEEPGRGLFWNRYGLALMERTRLAESEQALRRAIEIDRRDFAAQHYLGMVLHRTDRPAMAIAQYEKALELQPRNVFVLLNIGLSRMAIGDIRGAYQVTQKALEIDPGHYESLRFAGGCALQLGLLSEARRYLEAARRQQPNHPPLLQQLEVLRRREEGLEGPR